MGSEFDLIRQYFADLTPGDDTVVLGIGDDTAILRCPADRDLLVTVDTLVAGVHFPLDTAPADIGYKSLAVSVSDIAAMGGEARWATLALTLPEPNEGWLDGFARGLADACRAFGVALVGGDTTRGPLTISIQVMGQVAAGAALRRDGARVGDAIYVTGSIGDAGLGLALIQGRLTLGADEVTYFVQRLNRPTPRAGIAPRLVGLATAAIDVSDGLLADLGHILAASGVGAELELEAIPLAVATRRLVDEGRLAATAPLASGDDYELLFTAPPAATPLLETLAREGSCSITRIGEISADVGMRLRDAEGGTLPVQFTGYDHFGDSPA